MDIFTYIAYSDPYGAKLICTKFGYDISTARNEDDVAEALRQVVADQGEDAMKAIADLHPDKDLILEMAGKSPAAPCGCKDKEAAPAQTALATYVQDANQAVHGFSMNNGNTFLIAAVAILALAVISSSNNSKS